MCDCELKILGFKPWAAINPKKRLDKLEEIKGLTPREEILNAASLAANGQLPQEHSCKELNSWAKELEALLRASRATARAPVIVPEVAAPAAEVEEEMEAEEELQQPRPLVIVEGGEIEDEETEDEIEEEEGATPWAGIEMAKIVKAEWDSKKRLHINFRVVGQKNKRTTRVEARESLKIEGARKVWRLFLKRTLSRTRRATILARIPELKDCLKK